MAHLKDLIVSGVTRFIGKVYGTITNAIKDDRDQTISSTYIKDISGVGVNSLNITKGDGTSSNVTMSMEPRVVNLGDQETSTRSCVTSFGQGITIYACSNWTDKPAGAPDNQGTLITVAYNNTSNEMGTKWVWAHQYFMSPFVTYPWVRMGSSEVLTEWTPINRADIPPSNPNLLINPDFKINQRGFVSGSDVPAYTYTIDRWCADNTASNISVTSNGLKIQNLSGIVFATISQPIEHLNRGTYTLSAYISEYINSTGITARIHTYDLSLNFGTGTAMYSTGLYTSTFTLDADYDNVYIEIYSTGDGTTTYSFTLKWVKLEVGNAPTQFVPPDPATELLKCQRYYYRSGLIGFDKTTLNIHYAVFNVKFPVSMYRIPTVTLYSAKDTANTISTWADRVDSIGSAYINTPDLCTESFSAITSVNEFTLNESYAFYYIADAEIYRN